MIQGSNLVIAGRKVPIALLGVLATIAAALLVWRGRSTGAAAAATGAIPSTGSGVFGGSGGTDLSGDLAAANAQVSSLQTALATANKGVDASNQAIAGLQQKNADLQTQATANALQLDQLSRQDAATVAADHSQIAELSRQSGVYQHLYADAVSGIQRLQAINAADEATIAALTTSTKKTPIGGTVK